MECKNCGAAIKEGENFCSGCGARLSKTPLKHFEEALIYVREKEKFLLDGNLSGLTPEQAANKAIYKAMDTAIREKLSDADNAKLDKVNERKSVLERLKEQVQSRILSEADLNEILELKEFKEYMDTN